MKVTYLCKECKGEKTVEMTPGKIVAVACPSCNKKMVRKITGAPTTTRVASTPETREATEILLYGRSRKAY